MPRSTITSSAQDLVTDDGSLLISVVKGEQLRFKITLGWLTDLTGYTILCKAVEGLNDGEGTKPALIQPSGVITSLPIIDSVITDNWFEVVIPQTLANTWTVQPTPDKPSYAFFDLEVADAGSGNAQIVRKPVQGLVEVLFSPTEAA